MESLEEWLKTVPTEAVRELTGVNFHGGKKADMIAYIVEHPEARAVAEESRRIMQTGRR